MRGRWSYGIDANKGVGPTNLLLCLAVLVLGLLEQARAEGLLPNTGPKRDPAGALLAPDLLVPATQDRGGKAAVRGVGLFPTMLFSVFRAWM
jgi:hypothetical protein